MPSRDELRSMFKPVVERVIALIRQQRDSVKKENNHPVKVCQTVPHELEICRKAEKSKTVILCGGLANSPYIVKKIRKFCETHMEGVQVMMPDSPWSAISRGAALRVLQPRVGFRKVRRSYGICVHKQFIEGEDSEQDAFECPILGKRADNHMHWHVKKVSRLILFHIKN